jgi:hypothetical protein
MLRMVFELMIPVFEWAKTAHVSDLAATVIGALCRTRSVYFIFTAVGFHL